MKLLKQLKNELKRLANKNQARILQRFFKTGPGDYGEGDKFLGIKVPAQRIVAKKYGNLNLAGIQNLLNSKIHEYRLIALFILLDQYKHAEGRRRKRFVDFYLKNTGNINNWDLVDLSCHYILGDYLLRYCPPGKGGAGEVKKLQKSRQILYQLAKSKDLWQRRIAIISTFAFIRQNDFNDTFKIAEILLHDEHDLIHKAVGWMLREIGKRDRGVLEKFLRRYCKIMPRIMLRYAIEKFSQEKRKFYLGK